MTNAQKEAQKYIKKINQRLADVAGYMGFDSNEVAAYKQALDSAGINYDFKITKTAPQGTFAIANTKENRQKVTALKKSLANQKVKTKGDIKFDYKKKISEREKKPLKDVTQAEIEEEHRVSKAWNNLTSNLDILYRVQNDPRYSGILEEFIEKRKGKRKEELSELDEIVKKINTVANQAELEEKNYIEELDEEFEKRQHAQREDALKQLADYKQGEKGLPF